jgi:hypothetical protein
VNTPPDDEAEFVAEYAIYALRDPDHDAGVWRLIGALGHLLGDREHARVLTEVAADETAKLRAAAV